MGNDIKPSWSKKKACTNLRKRFDDFGDETFSIKPSKIAKLAGMYIKGVSFTPYASS